MEVLNYFNLSLISKGIKIEYKLLNKSKRLKSRVYSYDITHDDQYLPKIYSFLFPFHHVLDSIVVSIPACHAGDRGSIPRRGVIFCMIYFLRNMFLYLFSSNTRN